MNPFIKLTPYSQVGSALYLQPARITGFRRKLGEPATTVYADGQQFDVKEGPEQIADRISDHYHSQAN